MLRRWRELQASEGAALALRVRRFAQQAKSQLHHPGHLLVATG